MRRRHAELALSAGVLGLGVLTAWVTARLPGEGGYAGIGPNFIPAVVAAGLLVTGGWLLWEALSGGWRSESAAGSSTPLDPPASPGDAANDGAEHAFHAGAFGWITAGLFAHMALIGWAGFVIAGAVLFPCVARAFGSTRVARDAALGLVLSLAVFLFFVKLLNVNLPAGWLQPLLGSAGI
ncbi:MAG TPA: tripartite tricarboxylate transporter TctB family protein [Burkholderiales bacterium]